MSRMETTRPEPLAYTVAEAVVVSTLSRATLNRAMGSGKLKSRRCGARRLILAEDLEAFLRSLPVEPAA